jgi:hypothetical protein
MNKNATVFTLNVVIVLFCMLTGGVGWALVFGLCQRGHMCRARRSTGKARPRQTKKEQFVGS